MEVLRTISKILTALPIITFFYDLLDSWFVKAHFKIRSLKEWWTWLSPDSLAAAQSFISGPKSGKIFEKYISLSAPVALLIPPLILYFSYRLWFSIKGGKSGGGYVYKSRH